MSGKTVPFERYLEAKLEFSVGDHELVPRWIPSVTLSRQAGARAVTIGEKLTSHLQSASAYRDPHWTLFDQNLVETIIEDNHLPPEVGKEMRDDRVHLMVDAVRDMFRSKPDDWTLFNHCVHTIYKLCRFGHAVVVGRGGNFITADLTNTFRVRLVGTFNCRLEHTRNKFGMTAKAAEAYLHEKDAGRRRYVKSHFEQDIDDPAGYHLTINTDDLPDDSVVNIITHALEEWGSGPTNEAKGKSNMLAEA